MTSLSALIDRLAQATGPDRELDRAIAKARGATSTYDLATCPEYTGSVDVALTLVPDGMRAALDLRPTHHRPELIRALAWVSQFRDEPVVPESAATAALAVCCASLRAIDSGRTE